jgi:hypothetical protein
MQAAPTEEENGLPDIMTRTRCLIALLFCSSLGAAHEFSGAHGTVEIEWSLPNVSRILSSGYGDSFGADVWTRKGFPEPVEVDGRTCMQGTNFFFDIDDTFAFDIDETVTVTLLFDRRRTAGFMYGWDQNVEAENRTDVTFDESDEDWHEHTITLPRARFANRGESRTDLLIASLHATWTGNPNVNHKIVLCDLAITRSYESRTPSGIGALRLVISDGSEMTSARVGLYDESGRMPLPADGAVTINLYDEQVKQIFLKKTFATIQPWPHENRRIFYVDGEYETGLPVGRYQLVVTKGPEYRRQVLPFEVTDGDTTLLNVEVARWRNMADAGWLSGDDHVHMTRTPGDNASIATLARAEDLNVTNVLQMGNPYTTHFAQYAFGVDGRFQAGRHTLVPGVEDPRTAVRGHTISLNIQEVFRPADRYLRYDEIFAEYRRQGGISGFAHVAGRLFNVERGLAVDVPLGAVDFVELLQDGVLETELWYAFLNMGFKLIPMAGSDFPYYNPPGAERNYVYVGEDDSVDAYYDALRRQRTFVTNGPMLEFKVNGALPGTDLALAAGDEIVVEAHASLNPDIESIDRLELVVQGDVVATASDVSDDNRLSLFWTAKVLEGTWLAVRAYGTDQAVAHTAPVYVTTGGGFEKWSDVPALARGMMAKLDEFATAEADSTQELEAWSVGEPLERMLMEQRVAILERADEARAVYARLIDRP